MATFIPSSDDTERATSGARRAVEDAVRHRLWLAGTVGLTVGALVLAWALDPRTMVRHVASDTPGPALVLLLFVGSSVHVASTGWLFTIPEIRRHALAHRARYLYAPLALVAGTAVLAALVTPATLDWALLGYFAWQFFHFQRQNLGLAALAARSAGKPGLTRLERHTITAAGLGGIAGLLGHPALLQLSETSPLPILFPLGEVVLLGSIACGIGCLWLRRGHLDGGFGLMFGCALGFFGPVFAFTTPYAAVAGLVIAHGAQYLLLVGLVAGPRRVSRYRLPALWLLGNIAVAGGGLLTIASHLHGHLPVLRLFYGAYLGVVMAHFVIDAGLWRLRDAFPRQWLSASLPYLVAP